MVDVYREVGSSWHHQTSLPLVSFHLGDPVPLGRFRRLWSFAVVSVMFPYIIVVPVVEGRLSGSEMTWATKNDR